MGARSGNGPEEGPAAAARFRRSPVDGPSMTAAVAEPEWEEKSNVLVERLQEGPTK